MLDELCAATGWHRKHALRALRSASLPATGKVRRQRGRKYDAIKDALIAIWEACDRVCGKRLVVMIATLLPALERHGRLRLGEIERTLVLSVSAATIDRLLGEVKVAVAGGRRRRVGFYSAIRREVPTHLQRLERPAAWFPRDRPGGAWWHLGRGLLHSNTDDGRRGDTGWDRVPAAHCPWRRARGKAIKRAQSLFPWLLRGADFDNDSAVMNDVVVPWWRGQKIEGTRSRACKKNDQAFVKQKNGAVVRRLDGYGRFDGAETARIMARLYAAARLYVNFFQPSFKLKAKRREGAKDQALS
jgi:hypothetical protein